jgi:hypothetical protein
LKKVNDFKPGSPRDNVSASRDQAREAGRIDNSAESATGVMNGALKGFRFEKSPGAPGWLDVMLTILAGPDMAAAYARLRG